MYFGVFPANAATWYYEFETIASGVLTNPVSWAVAVRKNNSPTEGTTGLTLEIGFDGRTGVHLLTVNFAADAAFFTAGSEYRVFWSAGTLDGAPLNGKTILYFSIERAGGALALLKDSTFGLSALKTLVDELEPAVTAIEADTQDLQSRLPAALVSGRMDSSVGAMASNTLTAAAIAADAAPELRGVLASGTADSGTTTTLVDNALTQADTDYWKGCFILFTSGTLTGQCRLITGFNPTTDTLTFAPATTQAVSTHGYEILPAARVDLHLWLGSVANALISGRMDSSVGTYQTNQAPLQPTVAGRTLDVSDTGEAGIDWGNIGSPTTPVTLSGTTISTGQTIADVTTKTGYSLSSAGNNAVRDAIRDMVVEVQGNRTLQQVLSLLLAWAARTTDNGLTFQTDDGVATRIQYVVNVQNNRTSVTFTPSA
jgi:hypothetical protein